MLAPVVVVGLTLVVQEALEAIDRDAVHAALVAQTGCTHPCTLRITFAAGSALLHVEAVTPAAEAATVSSVAAAFHSVVTSDVHALGDALDVKVLRTSYSVTSTTRVMQVAVAPPPPIGPPPSSPPLPPASPTAPPPAAPVPDPTSRALFGLSITLLVAIIIGALAAVAVVILTVWCVCIRTKAASVAPAKAGDGGVQLS